MTEQEAIVSHIEECKHRIDNIKSFTKSNNDADCEQCANNICVLENVIKALEKQAPKKPIHIHEEYEKHQWKSKENGEVDDWAYSSGYCNGVVCERCGDVECVRCNPDYDNEPCIVDKDVCPVCGNRLYRYKKKKYCDECGQKLDWSDTDD